MEEHLGSGSSGTGSGVGATVKKSKPLMARFFGSQAFSHVFGVSKKGRRLGPTLSQIARELKSCNIVTPEFAKFCEEMRLDIEKSKLHRIPETPENSVDISVEESVMTENNESTTNDDSSVLQTIIDLANNVPTMESGDLLDVKRFPQLEDSDSSSLTRVNDPEALSSCGYSIDLTGLSTTKSNTDTTGNSEVSCPGTNTNVEVYYGTVHITESPGSGKSLSPLRASLLGCPQKNLRPKPPIIIVEEPSFDISTQTNTSSETKASSKSWLEFISGTDTEDEKDQVHQSKDQEIVGSVRPLTRREKIVAFEFYLGKALENQYELCRQVISKLSLERFCRMSNASKVKLYNLAVMAKNFKLNKS